MDWVKDMTARWVRIMSAAGDGRTSLDEAVHQISVIAGTPAKKGWFRSLTRDTRDASEVSAVTVLSRQLVAGVLVSDLMLDRLCAQSGQSRGQLLDQLTFGMPPQLRDQQVRALEAELSGSCDAGSGRRLVCVAGQPHRRAAQARRAAGLSHHRRGTHRGCQARIFGR